jgi:uncharacterized protein with HEPN domain
MLGEGDSVVSRDAAILSDILDAIAAIERATQSNREVFLRSAVIQDAILYRLVVIGEAVTRLSPELKAQHAEVDWRGITRFRNIAVHDYGHVDLAIVWDIVTQDLPRLKADAAVIRQERANQGES